MFDTSKLKGRIIEVFGTQGKFAAAIGRTQAFVSDVLNGKTYLGQVDIDKWAEALNISAEDIPAYFFRKKVHETEH